MATATGRSTSTAFDRMATMALESKDLDNIRDVLRMAKKKNIHNAQTQEAQIMLLDLEYKARVEDMETQSYFLKQGIDSKNRKYLHQTLQKLQKLDAQEPRRLMPAEFKDLVARATVLHAELQREHTQIAMSFMRQGLEQSNRSMLQEAFTLLAEVNRDDIDVELLHAATAQLQDLDRKSEVARCMDLAMTAQDMELLERIYNKGRLMGMARETWPKMAEAHEKLKKMQYDSTHTGGFGGMFSRTKKPRRVVFGGELKFQSGLSPNGIPMPVYESIDYMLEDDLATTGIFRVPGNNEQIDLIKAAYEAKEDVKFLSIHDASSILKVYLRELSEPLVPFGQYSDFIKVAEQVKKLALEDYKVNLKGLVDALPEIQRNNMRFLCDFLCKVEEIPENKMTAHNIAIVFAPNLLHPRVETATSMMVEMNLSIQIIEHFIVYFDYVFADVLPVIRLGHAVSTHL